MNWLTSHSPRYHFLQDFMREEDIMLSVTLYRMCVNCMYHGRYLIISSGNGLVPFRHQAIT